MTHETDTLRAAQDREKPRIERASMTPEPWTGFLKGLRMGVWQWLKDGAARLQGLPVASRHAGLAWRSTRSGLPAIDVPWRIERPWELAARGRRSMLAAIVAASTLWMALMTAQTQAPDTPFGLRLAHVLLFALLFAWVISGCLTAVFGFLCMVKGDRFALSASRVRGRRIDAGARTAVVMPIRNEDIATVFGGIQAMSASLRDSDAPELFDIWLLSDTDQADLRTAEVAAWHALRDAVAVHDAGMARRIHYRWRRLRARRKPGNVADFCRRHGRQYRYLVVLDADSIMSGDALVSLVRLMEAHPQAGIIQSVTKPCGQTTMHARAQQFAAQVTGRLFALGMQYWQLGESHYWGHNAIIRMMPFMKHCALAPLPGSHGPSGDILSHDFIEAALMRRAGYEVWMVFDLPDSYEQPPPNLIDELLRDRRWCQGNLKNARLLAEPGLRPVHRVMLLSGVMAYLSAPLWLAFVILGGVLTAYSEPDSMPAPGGLSPWLWAIMAALLLLPRALGFLAVLLRQEQNAFGGGLNLAQGVALEGLLSFLQAPVRMVAHSAFILIALSGLSLQWRSPPREARALGWRETSRQLSPVLMIVLALACAAWLAWPRTWWFVLPICLPVLCTIPVTVWTSRSGRPNLPTRRRPQALLTPEEAAPPDLLCQAWDLAERAWPAPRWTDLLHDADLFAMVKWAGAHRDERTGLCGATREQWIAQAARVGPEGLDNRQRLHLLDEPPQLGALRDALAANSPEMGVQHAA